MSVLIKGMEMPECCDKCWAISDYGDYPVCLITGETRGYNFRIRERRMDKCPLVEVPTPDVAKVVRCKDCELWSSCLSKQEKQVLIDTNTDGVCEYWMSDGLMPNDFCSYGRRKEGEE